MRSAVPTPALVSFELLKDRASDHEGAERHHEAETDQCELLHFFTSSVSSRDGTTAPRALGTFGR